jgi:hypothetical protein
MVDEKKLNNTDQEKTVLRIKLDELSAVLKKMAGSLISLESDNGIVLLESQMVNKLSALGTSLQSLESLEDKDGESFVAFLKNLTDIIGNIGSLPQWKRARHNEETFSGILTVMRNIEDQIKEFLKVVMDIDEKRKESHFETFGGLIQKLDDALEEKRHMILNVLERDREEEKMAGGQKDLDI